MTSIYLQTIVNGLMLGLLYVLIALGLTLIFSIMGILNFAHGEIYMLGAFSVYTLTEVMHLPFLFAIVLSLILIAFLGLVLERWFFRPLKGMTESSLIAALGLALLLQHAALLIWGIEEVAVTGPIRGVLRFWGVVLSKERLVTIVFSLISVTAVFIFIKYTRWGIALRAVAQDGEAAALQGMNIDRIGGIGFALGCALAAAAGCLMAPIFFISPYIGVPTILKALTIIILGGLGSIMGSLVGGLIIGMIESVGATFLGQASDMIGFAIIIAVMLIRPTGLFGHVSH
jgi:branched-chain amino acid transport system permease protein